MKPIPAPRAQELSWPYLPAKIGFLTGMLDMMGFLLLTGFFSANITGDLVESASYLVPGQQSHLLQILALPIFLVGVLLAYFLARRFGRASAPMVRSLLLTQLLLLTGMCLFSGGTQSAEFPAEVQHIVLGITAVLAVAISNTTMHMLDKQAPTTWALTANTVTALLALLNLTTHHGSADELAQDRQEWRRIWPVVVAFLLGGLLGTVASLRLHNWAWAVPAITALILLLLSWRPSSSSTADIWPPLKRT